MMKREFVTLKDGAGGRAMRSLIEDVFMRGATRIENGVGLADMDDGAAIPFGDQWIVVTTDSHVIQPIFFPGGDIGRLSICGTVNDLAMMGATEPIALTCGAIIEDGFPRESLVRIQQSMLDACAEAKTSIVTGDTKVMGKGEIDAIVLNTAGVGLTRRVIRDNGLQPGDRIIVTGTIGDHGFSVLARRHNLSIEGDLRSDVAPINSLVRAAMAAGEIHAMKDPTRGGLASALHEMAAKSRAGIVIDEQEVPVSDAVRAAAELTGIDPLHVANEGKAVLGVPADQAERVLAALREHPQGRRAAMIGVVVADHPGRLVLDTGFGKRLLAEPEGEPLPRIC